MSSSSSPSSSSDNTATIEATYPPCPRGGLVTCPRCMRTMAKDAMAYHLSLNDCQERLACQDERLDKPRGPQQLVRCLRCLRNFRQSAADEHLKTHAKAIKARN